MEFFWLSEQETRFPLHQFHYHRLTWQCAWKLTAWMKVIPWLRKGAWDFRLFFSLTTFLTCTSVHPLPKDENTQHRAVMFSSLLLRVLPEPGVIRGPSNSRASSSEWSSNFFFFFFVGSLGFFKRESSSGCLISVKIRKQIILLKQRQI